MRMSVLIIVIMFACSPLYAGTSDSLLVGKLEAETVETVKALIDTAAAEGLPGKVLVQKALEGVTKGAGEDMIVRAVRALLSRLRTARSILGEDASTSALTAAEGAIYAGVEAATIKRLHEKSLTRTEKKTSPGKLLTLELVIIADLVSRGVPVKVASDILLQMAEADMKISKYVEFRFNVERDIKDGWTPVESARIQARRILPATPVRPQERRPRRNMDNVVPNRKE